MDLKIWDEWEESWNAFSVRFGERNGNFPIESFVGCKSKSKSKSKQLFSQWCSAVCCFDAKANKYLTHMNEERWTNKKKWKFTNLKDWSDWFSISTISWNWEELPFRLVSNKMIQNLIFLGQAGHSANVWSSWSRSFCFCFCFCCFRRPRFVDRRHRCWSGRRCCDVDWRHSGCDGPTSSPEWWTT